MASIVVFFLRDANPLVEAVGGEASRQIAHAFGERRRVVGGVGENEAAPFADGDRQQSELGAIERAQVADGEYLARFGVVARGEKRRSFAFAAGRVAPAVVGAADVFAFDFSVLREQLRAAMTADIVKGAQDSVLAAHGENRLTAAFADDDISRRFDIFGAPDDDPRRFENAPFFDFEKAVVAVGGGIERPSAIDGGAGFGVGLGASEIGGGDATVGGASVGNGAVVGGNARRAVVFGRGFCGTGHHGFWRIVKRKRRRLFDSNRITKPADSNRRRRNPRAASRKKATMKTRHPPDAAIYPDLFFAANKENLRAPPINGDCAVLWRIVQNVRSKSAVCARDARRR